ncbi:MAG: hypothetical protein JXB25_12495 [Deltaproteobacteria bacterium]|nr:hypothetical protein [Deltaproteobacteria bacterium]
MTKIFAPRGILPLVLLCSGIVGVGFYCESMAAGKKPPEPAPVEGKADKEAADQKLVRVCSLNSVEANQEFQKNVRIMQAQKERVLQLQKELQQARTDDLKEGLKKELEEAVKKLEADNAKMVKAYGFSLNRRYLLVTEKASVFMYVTEEEAAKLEAEQKKAGGKVEGSGKASVGKGKT